MIISSIDLDSLYPNNSYQEAQVSQAIAAVDSAIRSYTGRNLTSRVYRDWFYLHNRGTMFLQDYPVTKISRLVVGKAYCLSLVKENGQASIVDDVLYLASDTEASFILADYATMADLATAIEAEGWTVALIKETSPKSLFPEVTTDAGTTTYLYCPSASVSGYSISDAGMVKIPYLGWVYCEYEAGYKSIPEDIRQVALEWTKALLDSSARDQTLQSEKIGSYSYTLSDAQSIASQFEMRLDPYRKRTVM